MKEELIHIFKAFFDFLFPEACIGCKAKNVVLCEKCLMSFPPPPATAENIFAATCYKNEVVKKSIWLLKYRGVKKLAEPLAELLFQRTKNILPIDNPAETLIIPIPLSPGRMKARGYNQTELIGLSLSDKMSIKISADVLYKIKETPSQVEIKDRNKRLKNILGAFEVKNPEIVENKTVILIDDITTTGATLNEAREVLQKAGAKKIICLVVAKG